jgi:hypothetical protein
MAIRHRPIPENFCATAFRVVATLASDIRSPLFPTTQ